MDNDFFVSCNKATNMGYVLPLSTVIVTSTLPDPARYSDNWALENLFRRGRSSNSHGDG